MLRAAPTPTASLTPAHPPAPLPSASPTGGNRWAEFHPYIPVWLAKPIEALDDEKPLDLIGRGEYRRVARVVSELEDPGSV